MTKSIPCISPENWRQIRNSSPFSQQLTNVDSGLLTDDAFLAPLPLQVKSELICAPQDGRLEVFQASYRRLQLIALVGSPYEVILKSSEWISLILVNSGEVCITQNGLRWCSTAGGCLIVSGQLLHWSSTAFSVVCIMLPVKGLPKLAETYKGSPNVISRIYSAIESQQVCMPSCDVLSDLLISHLNSSIDVIGQFHGSNSELVLHLDLVEHLYRLLSVLIFRPRIASPPRLFQASPGNLRDSFDDLLEYIQANLHLTLNLSVLERRSNYSRRTLQYAFRDRKGCTATQWIRSCRLELARKLILSGTAGDSVANIALTCGYRSMSLFSIEFQQRFHVKPSNLLRTSQPNLHRELIS